MFKQQKKITLRVDKICFNRFYDLIVLMAVQFWPGISFGDISVLAIYAFC